MRLMARGGGPIESMIVATFLGAYACLELFRSSQRIWAKSPCALLGLPLVALIGITLHYTTSRCFRPWLTAWLGTDG